ncbi:MAG: hypothetical protein ACXAEI_04285 [Candidatus Hodarchaeales archaeon]
MCYDPSWQYTPKDHPPFWASLDTVDFVSELLEDNGNKVLLVKTDGSFENRLRKISSKNPKSLVFWLNEFMPTSCGLDIFTVSVIERVGMMHTGPNSKSLLTGLNKETTKAIFRKLGLQTPISLVIYPGDYLTIHKSSHWDCLVIVKPLLQGNSRGIDETSIIHTADQDSLRERVEEVQNEFGEPALIEKFIGVEDVNEFTVPMLISHDGRIADLPITEIDLSQIPPARENFRLLTNEIKDEKYYLKIPADLPLETEERISSEVRRIITEIDCRDMVRVDIRTDPFGVFYLEINVNPGKNRFSYLTLAAQSIGIDYPELISFIPYQAMLKYRLEPPEQLAELVRPVIDLFDLHLPSAKRPHRTLRKRSETVQV